MNRGSEWRIWDLHFHTPSSYDYQDRSVNKRVCQNANIILMILQFETIQ